MGYAIQSKGTALSFPARIREIATQGVEAYTSWRAYRRTFAELSELSNYELNDLGINRSELTRVAYEATYGQST